MTTTRAANATRPLAIAAVFFLSLAFLAPTLAGAVTYPVSVSTPFPVCTPEGGSGPLHYQERFSLSWLSRDARDDVGALGLTQKDYFLLSIDTPTFTPSPTPIVMAEWKVYKTANSGLGFNSATCVLADDAHRLWFGTDWGVSLYSAGEWQVFHKGNSGLTSDFISCIAQGNQNQIIVGMKRDQLHLNGVAVFEDGRWVSDYVGGSVLNDVKGFNPTALAVDTEGRLWVGTANEGLWLKDKDTWQLIPGPPSLQIVSLKFDESGKLWIGTKGQGYSIYDGHTFENHKAPDVPIPGNILQGFEFLPMDFRWFSCGWDGIALLNQGQWSTYGSDVFGGATVRALHYQSEFDKLWAASGSGAWMLDKGFWQNFKYSNSGIPGDNVYGLDIDWRGHVWFSTSVGVAEYNEKAQTHGMVTGRVADDLDKPIPGALITISGGQSGVTDTKGEYAIDDVSYGENWVVYADAEGYLPVREANVQVSPTKATQIDIRLTRASLEQVPANWDAPAGLAQDLFVSNQGGDLDQATSRGRYAVSIVNELDLPIVGGGDSGRLLDPKDAVTQGLLPKQATLDLSIMGLIGPKEIDRILINDFSVPASKIRMVNSQYRWQRIRVTFNITDNWLVFPRPVLDEQGPPTFAENRIVLELKRPAIVDWIALDISGKHTSENPGSIGRLSDVPDESTYDLNHNWKYDALMLNFRLDTSTQGECFTVARLEDDDGNPVADAEAWIDLKTGLNLIPLLFPGGQVYQSGVNGPYHLAWVALYTNDASQTISLDSQTHAYDFTEFEPLGISAQPTATPPNRTPTPTSFPDFTGDYQAASLDMFQFARFWRQPSARSPILNLIPDDWIDEKDLLAFLSGWHSKIRVRNGDFNQNGVTDETDIFDYVNQWKRSNTDLADMNDDRKVDGKDVYLFIEAWHTHYKRQVGVPME